MNARVKVLRKKMDLTQREFGERLGVQDTAISKIESGERNLTDQMTLAICREFSVNENWLRTGAGGDEAIFVETDGSVIANLVSEYGLDEMSEMILRTYVEIDEKQRKPINDFIHTIALEIVRESIKEAKIGVVNTISDSCVSEAAKRDLLPVVLQSFNSAFPYVGVGNVDPEEQPGISDDSTATISVVDKVIDKVINTYQAADSSSGKEHGIVPETTSEIERLKNLPRITHKDDF